MFTPEIEPIIPSDSAISHSELPSLALELERKSAALGGALAEETARLITDSLRVINSYYSNLIEGHDTELADIREAMSGNFSDDTAKRNKQLESVAHIQVQQLLDENPPSREEIVNREFIKKIHCEFYERSPHQFRILQDGSIMEPGVFRDREVTVGEHLAPAPDRIDALISRFEQAFSFARVRHYPVIAAMAAHHRLLWIHPFSDGNGRTGRLFTDAMLKAHGVGGVGVWCLSRGLARSTQQAQGSYKYHMMRADQPRKGDTDGRGALSESEFITFIQFMIKTAIDQVDFMQKVTEPLGARTRIDKYIAARNNGQIIDLPPIKPEASRLLKIAYIEGQVQRSQMEELTGYKSTAARKLVQQMKAEGLLTETSSRSPLKLGLPAHFEAYILPGIGPTVP